MKFEFGYAVLLTPFYVTPSIVLNQWANGGGSIIFAWMMFSVFIMAHPEGRR